VCRLRTVVGQTSVSNVRSACKRANRWHWIVSSVGRNSSCYGRRRCCAATRANTLEAAIVSAKKQPLRGEASSILTEVGGLELGFQRVNRTVLYVVVVLFTGSVAVFAYCTIWQDAKAGAIGSLTILGFYLLLPITIFVIVGLYVKRRCAEIDGRIARLQANYLTAALGN
jgi:hypothetical protein